MLPEHVIRDCRYTKMRYCLLTTSLSSLSLRYQGLERGVQAFYKPSSTPSVHCFLGAVELERPLASLWSMVRDHSKTHLYHKAIHSARTRPLDDSTQLGESAGWSIAGLRSILYLKMVKAFNAAAHAKTGFFGKCTIFPCLSRSISVQTNYFQEVK